MHIFYRSIIATSHKRHRSMNKSATFLLQNKLINFLLKSFNAIFVNSSRKLWIFKNEYSISKWQTNKKWKKKYDWTKSPHLGIIWNRHGASPDIDKKFNNNQRLNIGAMDEKKQKKLLLFAVFLVSMSQFGAIFKWNFFFWRFVRFINKQTYDVASG